SLGGLGDLGILAGAKSRDLSRNCQTEFNEVSYTSCNGLLRPVVVYNSRTLPSLVDFSSSTTFLLAACSSPPTCSNSKPSCPVDQIQLKSRLSKMKKVHYGVLTPGRATPQSPHLGEVPFFWMWR